MNFKILAKFNAYILTVVSICMIPSVILCLVDGDGNGAVSFAITMIITVLIALVLFLVSRNAKKNFQARDGLVGVGIAWLGMSALGALPFYISGQIPKYIDAFFETVSGFTTTGSSILFDVEALTRGMLWWRSFTHWLGGMGILVLILAIVPGGGREGGFSVNFLRAESPGPEVGKPAPRVKETAKILYIMYTALTAADIIALIIARMPVFDAFCLGVGTAGTGGFGVLNTSLASYTPAQQWITTVFMFLFGVNFSCYYLIIIGKFKAFLKDTELRFYWGMIFASAIVIIINISIRMKDMYPTLGDTIRHAFFQVGAVITTTGYTTTDFNIWPTLSKIIMVLLMMIGACAGSTGGGFKCARVILLIKILRRNFHQITHPKEVRVVRFNGNPVEEKTLKNVSAYLVAYSGIMLLSILIIAFDNFSIETTITSVIATLNNIGPGLDGVGPTSNFAHFSVISKIVLILDMLIGRLEIFPILVLFSKSTWIKSRDSFSRKSESAKLKSSNYEI